VPKILSERCELVKLGHINHSGPVFFETQCRRCDYPKLQKKLKTNTNVTEGQTCKRTPHDGIGIASFRQPDW